YRDFTGDFDYDFYRDFTGDFDYDFYRDFTGDFYRDPTHDSSEPHVPFRSAVPGDRFSDLIDNARVSVPVGPDSLQILSSHEARVLIVAPVRTGRASNQHGRPRSRPRRTAPPRLQEHS